jgi:hypothetical protein
MGVSEHRWIGGGDIEQQSQRRVIVGTIGHNWQMGS